MAKNKDLIYDFVRETIYKDPISYPTGITTELIANKLQMQRSNVSAVLNKLVQAGQLKKNKVRPVRFTLADVQPRKDPFDTLIGHDGSLKKAVQLAKAAVLYPRGNLNIQITAQPGSGTSFFVDQIVRFTKLNQVISQDAPFFSLNCRNYANDIHALDVDLFGQNNDFKESYFERARGGILFINHYEYLDAAQQAHIIDWLDMQTVNLASVNQAASEQLPLVIFSCSTQGNRQIERKLSVTVTLPALDERPLNEKLKLINHFFDAEARASKRTIIISTPVAKALLLADYVHNVKELQTAVVMACANAYVRVVNDSKSEVSVYLNDLKASTRQALLKEKENQPTMDMLFEDTEKMIFSPHLDDSPIVENYFAKLDPYGDINKQYALLADKGLGGINVKNAITDHIKRLFDRYDRYDYLGNEANQAQLAKIVDPTVIKIVRNWLDDCRKELKRNFENSVFYGLCLHINSLQTVDTSQNRINHEQVQRLIGQYPQEYKASAKLAQILHNNLNLNISLEETVLIMMFLITPEQKSAQGHPVILYVMHGNGTAKSLMETTNALVQKHYAYAYDMNLGIGSKLAMADIKAKIQNIDQGQGVIVIYDMGSIKIMLDTISDEIDIKIRMIQIPITLVGIEAAHKSSMEHDIDNVYHAITSEMHQLFDNEPEKKELFVTLCHTGEGGADQLKKYIDEYSKLGIQVKALSMSNREKLTNEVSDLLKTYKINAFIGTFDPKLFGIPFIPINQIFENSRQSLDQILTFKPVLAQPFEYDQIYTYFQEQFRYASVAKLRRVLPEIMDKLSMTYDLNESQCIGLFVHLGSMVERTLSNDNGEAQTETRHILARFPDDYKIISKSLRPLEHLFNLIVTDDEIATIITIVKQL